jgi:hypothetical protein
VLDRIGFLLPGASIKEINSTSDAAITLDHVYSIFVGGNKLGRGVTIPNLITSYYGRNPKKPNADTVLQHARMYGYREKHIGVTRLFLRDKLADHFRLIHQMETALRNLVDKYPEGKFEGIYISSPLQATRANVLDPNSIGVYVAGGYCNPRSQWSPDAGGTFFPLTAGFGQPNVFFGFDGKGIVVAPSKPQALFLGSLTNSVLKFQVGP